MKNYNLEKCCFTPLAKTRTAVRHTLKDAAAPPPRACAAQIRGLPGVVAAPRWPSLEGPGAYLDPLPCDELWLQ